MRIHVLFIFAFVVLAFAGPARAYDPEFSKIVSYSRLMSLSPEKRAEYIRQVRLMVSEFEENQKTFSADSQAVADSTERNFFLDMMIQDAVAMGAGPGGGAYKAATTRLQTQRPPAVAPRRPPTDAERRDWAKLIADSIRCPALRFRDPNMARRLRENGAQVQCLSNLYMRCNPGFRQIGGTGTKRICYKDGLTDQQVAQRRQAAALQAQRDAAAKRAPVVRPAAARRVASANAGSRTGDGGRSRSAETPGSRARTRPSNEPMPGASTPDQLDAAIGDADAVRDNDEEGTTADTNGDVHRVSDRLPAFRINRDAVFNLNENAFNYRNADDAQCADRLSVESVPATCSAANIQTARQAYFRQSEPHCLFAGNLRHYRNNQKKPGLCQHPREFCISNVACRNPDESFVNSRERIVVKCTGAGEILCNPMLFDLNEDGRALCIPPTKDATLKCNERAEQVRANLRAKDPSAPYIPFITRVKTLVNTNDREADAYSSAQGVKDAWDDFAAEMNKICDVAPSKDLFCRECQIMKRRAADLNLITFNGGVPKANGNCYEFNELRLNGNPSNPATSTGSSRNAPAAN